MDCSKFWNICALIIHVFKLIYWALILSTLTLTKIANLSSLHFVVDSVWIGVNVRWYNARFFPVGAPILGTFMKIPNYRYPNDFYIESYLVFFIIASFPLLFYLHLLITDLNPPESDSGSRRQLNADSLFVSRHSWTNSISWNGSGTSGWCW
jgi:hypothetical protein